MQAVKWVWLAGHGTIGHVAHRNIILLPLHNYCEVNAMASLPVQVCFVSFSLFASAAWALNNGVALTPPSEKLRDLDNCQIIVPHV